MNVVSVSLYGPDPKYVVGAVKNADLVKRFYPGWEYWVYTEQGHAAIGELICAGAKVWQMPPSVGHEGMFWRFLAIDEPGVERMIVRDADSRVNAREAAAVSEWIAEGTDFHVMRDHPDHAHWPILGGMWGCAGGAIRSMWNDVCEWPKRTAKLDDMRFLGERIWPLALKSMTHHSSVPTPHPNAKPFPPHESVQGFCGEIIGANA